MSAKKDQAPGRFKKSWLLFKGSWKALNMDRELVAIPIISSISAIVVLAMAGVTGFLARNTFFTAESLDPNGKEFATTPWGMAFWIFTLLILTALGVIFSGALMHGALERFKGNDPTIRSSIKAALKRSGSLVVFGTFSAIIGYIFSEIAERIPFLGGKIIAWLAGSAWNVASFFAIPVIVTSDKPVYPVEATQKSIKLIKKTWGESLIVSVGISLFAMLGFILYFIVIGGIGALLVNTSITDGWLFAGSVVGMLGFVMMILVFTMLETFAKAAIYHYATTGEAPAHFDERMMKNAFTPRKARKLFGAV